MVRLKWRTDHREERLVLLKRILIGLVRSHEVTGEKAKDPNLKSRHYRLPKDKAWDEITSTLKKMRGYRVLHEVPSVGEIIMVKRTILGRTMDITVQVISTGVSTTAVDIYSASRGGFGDLGANYRVIQEVYAALDRKLAAYKM